MKSIYRVSGMAVLLVSAALGQGAKPGTGRPAPGFFVRPGGTQGVVRAGAPAIPAPEPAPVVTTQTVVSTALASVPSPAVPAPAAPTQAVVVVRATNTVVATPPVAVPAAATQAVARAASAPAVVTPFMTKSTARTAVGITNALVRWGAWAPGDKEGELRFPTERAVLASLNWLQREQQADGSWKGSKEIATPALTALALLTYLGHGETPASATYGTTVRKALDWLLANQEVTGLFKGRDDRNYALPMAALALSEAYGLTLDPDIKVAAEKSIQLIVKGQHATGGFSYNLDKAARDDTSYMSWCAQALAAARMAKLEVPNLDRVMEKAVFALRQNGAPGGGFGESGPGNTSLSGAGVAGLQFLGAPRAPEAQKTLELFSTNAFSVATEGALPYPGASRFYDAWNLTQAKFQAGEEPFRAWNKSLARELVGSQIRQRNLLTKWVDLGRWERPAANLSKEAVLQDTCYATLMLEVYYRYLPFK